MIISEPAHIAPSHPVAPSIETVPAPKIGALNSNKATVVVHLPADAKLFVDNQACPLTSEVRKFETPELVAGKKYFYNLKTEVVKGGETKVETRKIVFEAGKTVEVDFNKQEVASK